MCWSLDASQPSIGGKWETEQCIKFISWLDPISLLVSSLVSLILNNKLRYKPSHYNGRSVHQREFGRNAYYYYAIRPQRFDINRKATRISAKNELILGFITIFGAVINNVYICAGEWRANLIKLNRMEFNMQCIGFGCMFQSIVQ